MLLPNDFSGFSSIQKAFASSTGVTTDTRTANVGKLFFALQGDNFNGNQYAQKALEQGCVSAVIDDAAIAREVDGAILVDDVLSLTITGKVASQKMEMSGHWPYRQQWENDDQRTTEGRVQKPLPWYPSNHWKSKQ